MRNYKCLMLSLVSVCFVGGAARASASVPSALQGDFAVVSCQIQQGQSYLSLAHVVPGTNVQFVAKDTDIDMLVTKEGGSWGFLTFANINGSPKENKSYDPFPFGCTGTSESSTATDSALVATVTELTGIACSKTSAVNKAGIKLNANGALTYSEFDTRDGVVTYQATCVLSK